MMRSLAAILLLIGSAFGSGTAVQVALGGHATGANNAACQAGITATGNYPVNTTIGNTLILYIWGSSPTVSNLNGNMAYSVTTSGVTWTQANGSWVGQLFDNVNHIVKQTSAYGVFNAASISSGTTISVNAITASNQISSCNVEFVLFEISGLTSSAFVSGVLAGTLAGTTPSGSMTGTAGHTGFVIFGFSGEGSSALTAGTGYTLGPNAVTTVLGQIEYASAQPTSVTASFAGGANPGWVGTGLWFTDGVISATSVARHQGSVF